MTSFELRHPESDLLLQFLDGELPRRKARQVRLHVEACWQCRAELDELQKLVAECVRYRSELTDALPLPPKPWADLSRDFQRLDESPASESFLRRPAFRWALVGAGAVSLMAATLALQVFDFRISPGPSTKPEPNPASKKELPAQQASPASTTIRAGGVIPSAPGRASAGEEIRLQASVGDELRAVAALHRLGADLGEPVEVARNGAYVVVGGTGVSPVLQRQIREALVSEPNVQLHFSDPPAGPPAPPSSAGATAPRTAAAAGPNALEAQVGGRAQLEKLSAQLLDRDEAAMARVYALRRLAEQFPPEAERQLNPEEQRLLKELGREHVAALVRETAAIESAAAGLLPSGASTSAGLAVAATSWQETAQNLFTSARQVERLLPAWLGATSPDLDNPPATPGRDFPGQLAAALAQLQADVQQCERLLKP